MSGRRLLAIYGASGAGRAVMPLLRAQTAFEQNTECVFVDDAAGPGLINGYRCLTFEQFIEEWADEKAAAIAVAEPSVRRQLAHKCMGSGIGFLSVISQQHVRMEEVDIGEGALFSPFTTVTSNVRIGRHFHCNINSYVEHDCEIGDFVTFAPGVQCNGNVCIDDGAYIGAGAMIRQGRPGNPLRIGAGAVIGMGAVVLRDVPAGATIVGNPARLLGTG